MTRRITTLAAIAAFGVALAPPVARADEQIVAAPPNRYVDSDVAIDQGERVTFTNNDTVMHDVVAKQKGADGKPLFASELVATGRSAPVSGTEYLTTGDYAFFCSLHPQMTGTLRVSSAGTPVPRPGTGTQDPSPPATGDRTAPALKIGVRDRRLATVGRRRALRLSVTVDEAAAVRIALRAGRTRLGSATVRLTAAGTRVVSVKLTRAGTRLARRSRSLRVAVTATARDGADNAVTLRKKQTLRRKGR